MAILIVVITAAVATATKTLVESLLGGLSYGRTLAVIASAAIWFVGIAAALNQIEVAPEIVNGLFYAVLALVVGVGIVAIGGGGIQPMRERWQRALSKVDQEAPLMKREAQAKAGQVREEMGDKAEQVRREMEGASPPDTGSVPTQPYRS